MALLIQAEPIPLDVDTSGTVRVGGTRLTLETVMAAFRRGEKPEEIGAAFPGVELADLYAVITYCLRHPAEVDDYLRTQQARAARIRRKIEARQGDQRDLRGRLVARQTHQQPH